MQLQPESWERASKWQLSGALANVAQSVIQSY